MSRIVAVADDIVVIDRQLMFEQRAIITQKAVLNRTGGHDIAHKADFFVAVGHQKVGYFIARIEVVDDITGIFVDVEVKEDNRISIMKKRIFF